MKKPETVREVHGLVVNSVDIGERDRLLTVLTGEMGLVTVFGASCRQLKSRYMAATQMMSYGKFLLRESGDRLSLKEAEVMDTFYGLRTDIGKASLAAYLCEVLTYTGTEQGDNDLLRLALNTLYVIEKGLYPLSHIKATFEYRLAAHLGFMPDVSACRICGSTGESVLEIPSGQILCEECRNTLAAKREEGPMEIALLSSGARAAIHYIVTAPLEKVFSYRLEEDDRRLLSHSAEDYLLYHTDHMYATLTFYKQVID